MFDHTSHDLGVVARGAKVEHRFTIENNNEEDIRIESVKSSCGCTTAKLTKQVLKSWEKAEIVVTLDTRGEPGRKDATITVVFAPPFTAEVQLHVHAFIRGDVVVQPGAAEFGLVGSGGGRQPEAQDQLRRPPRLADRCGSNAPIRTSRPSPWKPAARRSWSTTSCRSISRRTRRRAISATSWCW